MNRIISTSFVKAGKICIAFGSLMFLYPQIVKAQVVINEFVPDASPEWVEFKNASDSAEFIKNYFLDDDLDFNTDTGSSTKKALLDLVMTDVTYPYIDISSFLNNSGDFVVLFNPEGGIVDQYQYTSNPGSGVSIGRSPDGTGDFFILSSVTKSSQNSDKLVSPTPTSTSTPTTESTPTATATSTSTPTNTPTPIPTKTSSPKPTSSPTAKSSPLVSLSDQGPTGVVESDVLGLRNELNTVTEASKGGEKKKGKIPPVSILFLMGGAVAIFISAITFLKGGKVGYNENNEVKLGD